MLSVWWNFEGVLHFEMVPEGRSVTGKISNNDQSEAGTSLARQRSLSPCCPNTVQTTRNV
jgi:hypothetical protein